MGREDRVEVTLVLTCPDDQTQSSILQQLSADAGRNFERSTDAGSAEFVVLAVRNVARLGAFESAFLLGMTVSVALSATGVGAWCLAHHRRGGGPIAADSEDGRTLIAAAASALEPPASPLGAAGDEPASAQP
jgi:hypothetical protein